MRVRHGFRPVPRWRVKAQLGVVVAAALVSGIVVSGSPTASAAPADPAPSAAPAQGSDELQAPDIATAQTIARSQQRRVEVVGERTESSTTWVNPDGSLTTGQATSPVWVRQGDGDGTKSTDWAPVDLTLAFDEDGNVQPKADPAGLVLAGAGVPENGRLVALADEGGPDVGIDWSTALPKPTLAGPRATYADVQPGVDLVVEATRTGYEQFFVLKDRPATPEQAPTLSLTMSGDGLAAVESSPTSHGRVRG